MDADEAEHHRTQHLFAIAVEAGFVLTFLYHESILGFVLCGAYAWYSATWAWFTRPKNPQCSRSPQTLENKGDSESSPPCTD